MQILVTGGAGFIGSHLSEKLIADGHRVTVLDNYSTGCRENLGSVAGHANFKLVEGSVLDESLVQVLVGASDAVFHLAAAVGVKLIMEQPSHSILTNINGTENVLKAAIPNKILTFIASSSEVYGKAQKIPFAEDDDLTIGATTNLRWAYASAKTVDEFLALAYAREVALPVVVCRF
ncbi:MAG: GDP-mannose 4,6-dehydratase, partial [Lysobacterales bacterium]